MRDDKYKTLNTLGSQNVPRAVTQKIEGYQAEGHHDTPGKRFPAWQCPSRKNVGNDMGNGSSFYPNATNGSRQTYCTNEHADSLNKLKGQINTDGFYLDQK